MLPLEQRRAVGREPRSERRSVEQPEYLGESLQHLRHHRAPITATRPMDTAIHHTDIPRIGILLTGIRAMDTQPTHNRAMDIRATLGTRSSLLAKVRHKILLSPQQR